MWLVALLFNFSNCFSSLVSPSVCWDCVHKFTNNEILTLLACGCLNSATLEQLVNGCSRAVLLDGCCSDKAYTCRFFWWSAVSAHILLTKLDLSWAFLPWKFWSLDEKFPKLSDTNWHNIWYHCDTCSVPVCSVMELELQLGSHFWLSCATVC